VLPVYRSKFSRRDFRWPQLVACLIVQRFFRLDYRGMEQLLKEHSGLRRVLRLQRVPDHTTLCRALKRLTLDELGRLLDETVARIERCRRRGRPPKRKTLVVDSTGLRADHASRYFFRRLKKTQRARRYPKWSLAVDRKLHVILAQVADSGPCSDHVEFKTLVEEAQRRRPSVELLGDAGYDSEENRRWCTEELGLRPIIRVKTGRPSTTGEPMRGPYRRAAALRFPCRRYGQRWQVESTISAHKRRFGDELASTTSEGRRKETLLRGILHNCASLRRFVSSLSMLTGRIATEQPLLTLSL
jgi:IS5 family transposase